jgi:hypothetical protein
MLARKGRSSLYADVHPVHGSSHHIVMVSGRSESFVFFNKRNWDNEGTGERGSLLC